jgi:hypothetical protein
MRVKLHGKRIIVNSSWQSLLNIYILKPNLIDPAISLPNAFFFTLNPTKISFKPNVSFSASNVSLPIQISSKLNHAYSIPISQKGFSPPDLFKWHASLREVPCVFFTQGTFPLGTSMISRDRYWYYRTLPDAVHIPKGRAQFPPKICAPFRTVVYTISSKSQARTIEHPPSIHLSILLRMSSVRIQKVSELSGADCVLY